MKPATAPKGPPREPNASIATRKAPDNPEIEALGAAIAAHLALDGIGTAYLSENESGELTAHFSGEVALCARPVLERLVRRHNDLLTCLTGQWRPIATAPKDGTPVLVRSWAWGGGKWTAYWQPHELPASAGWRMVSEDPGANSDWIMAPEKITHWQPLPPDPPK